MILIVAILALGLYFFLGVKKPGTALITSPIAAVGGIYFGAEYDTVSASAIAIIIFPATLATIITAHRNKDEYCWPYEWAKWISAIVGICVLLAILGALFSSGLFYAGFFLLLAFASFARYAATSRHVTALYIISTIGSSLRQNLPLATALQAAASGRRNKQSKILRSISKWLVEGYTLSQAIKRGYPKCPAYATSMIAAAEKIGQLPKAIKSVEADMIEKADESKKIRPFNSVYPVVVLTIAFFIVGGLVWFILPKFKNILTEAGIAEMPWATQVLIDIAGYMLNDAAWVVVLLVLVVLVGIVVSTRARLRPRRPEKPYLISRIADFIKWNLPVLHWFELNYSLVRVVELLKISLNAGCTVNESIRNTLGMDVNNRFRKRLARWLEKVEQGQNISTAAGSSRIGSAIAWAFDDQINPGNAPDILEMLEQFYRTNYSYRANLTRFILEPCVVLMMGVCIGFIVYALFVPMVAITNHYSNGFVP